MSIRIIKIAAFIVIIALVILGAVFIFRDKGRTVKIENVEQELIIDPILPEQAKEELQTEEQKEEEIDNANKIEKANETEQAKPANNLQIKNNLVSFGFAKASGRNIDTIIVHSSYDALGDDPYNFSGLIKEYKQYGVAPHYLIDRKGNIYRLVEEKNIAYHAGVGEVPDGRSGVNNFSLGIELMNTKTDNYTNEQYAALRSLLADIKKRYKIKYTLGHKDIASGRKDDPWNFKMKL